MPARPPLTPYSNANNHSKGTQNMTQNIRDLNIAYSTHIQALRNAPGALAETLRTYRSELARIEADPNLSHHGRITAMDTLRQQAVAHVQTIGATVEDAKERIGTAVQQAQIANDTTDTAALLTEMREQRAWRRVERFLEGGADPVALVGRFEDDPAAVQAMRAELPGYVEATTADAHELRDTLEVLGGALETAEDRHLTDVERRSKQVSREHEAADYRVGFNMDAVNAELDGRGEAGALLDYAKTSNDSALIDV